MQWILLALSLLPSVLPWLNRGAQMAQVAMVAQQAVQATQVQQPIPAEAGQPGVVFHNGQWWKWDGAQWWVWVPNQMQGGQRAL